MGDFILGVDVGGTFTDLLLVNPREPSFRVAKVPTTPGDQSTGFMDGLRALDVNVSDIETIVHGTTIGTNAILERRGVRTGLITTQGFRDVLELGRRTRPNAYGLFGTFEPLIPRDLRLEVDERIDVDGNVLTPLDEPQVRTAMELLRERGAEALVIHFIHAYINPSHEQRCLEIAREVWPDSFVTAGSTILPEFREFERGTTAALNGYIQPIMSRYIGWLSNSLAEQGFANELLVMQGNGGMMDAATITAFAVHTVMSGPAAGAIAAARIAETAGFSNVISCDMGGTSFDVALIQNGLPALSSEKDISYGVPVRIPMVDIHTIGAGGGSIARVNQAGILQVGPESAGSNPGPIGFGRGGQEPTVTDANLLLGRINAGSITGTDRGADLDQVRSALVERIGSKLGLDAEQTAAAILTVANNQLAGAIRLVSIEKGFDPRDFVLFAFGGAGPLHAAELARELGVPTVLVPRFPGITSALGCVLADVRHDFSRTLNQPLAAVDPQRANEILREQTQAGRALLEHEKVEVTQVDLVHEADLLYQGQTHVLRVPVDASGFDSDAILARFAEQYLARFDIELSEMKPRLVNLRTTVFGRRESFNLNLFKPDDASTLEAARVGQRRVYFNGDWHDETPVYRREALPLGVPLAGPAIIEQLDTTIVLDPQANAQVDQFGNLIINVNG